MRRRQLLARNVIMKKPGDNRPDPPGGRAAERLREFEEARLPPKERELRKGAETGKRKRPLPNKSKAGRSK
jgi:hypothetical protein